MPTPFIARTGELTPPGMYWSASSNRRADVSVFTRVLPASDGAAAKVALYYAPPRVMCLGTQRTPDTGESRHEAPGAERQQE